MGNKLFHMDCFKYAQNTVDDACESPEADDDITQVTRQGMKVLFLDVDGVLNTKSTRWNSTDRGIEDSLLDHLKIILLKSQCKIVLSTTWRLYENYTQVLLDVLAKRAGINTAETVIGQTPNLPQSNRVTEILTFVYDYNRDKSNKFYISNFCAVDDMPLHKMTESELFNIRFVKTDKRRGISVSNVIQCVHILNSEQ